MGFFAETATPVTTSLYQTPTTTMHTTSFGGAFWGLMLIYLIVAVLAIVAYWRIFSKAGEAGWQSIIPIWSTIVLLKIVGRPTWWILLLLIPVVNFVVLIVVLLDLGKSFGKSTMFSVFGLIIFSLIGYYMLGFGDDKYIGPGGRGVSPTASSPVAN